MSCLFLTFSVFLVNFLSIIHQFLSNFWQFFPQFFHKMFCQFNYILNYCWKSIVKSIIFSIIAWCGFVEPGFESSLNPSLDSEGKGLSRVWTQAYNWPIRGSVSDPCPCLCLYVTSHSPESSLLQFRKCRMLFLTALHNENTVCSMSGKLIIWFKKNACYAN